jgi:hypothetical protein
MEGNEKTDGNHHENEPVFLLQDTSNLSRYRE